MKKQTMLAVIGATVATVLLSALRLTAVSDVLQNAGGTYNLPWLCLTAVLLLALLFCGRVERNEPHALTPVAARAVGLGALLTGVALLVSLGSSLLGWLTAQTLPYPVNDPFGMVDIVLFYLLAVLELASGGALLLVGIRSFFEQRLPNTVGFSALLPVFWMWIRIVRYELSYVSSLQSARHWQDLLMLVFELLFLMAFARFLSCCSAQPPRLLAGLGLCAGVTATVGCVSRLFLSLTDGEAALSVCGLIVAADLGIAVLGFATAFGWLTALPAAEEEPSAPEPTVQEDEEDEEDEPTETDLLLNPELFQVPDEDDGLYDIKDESRRPLELEDVINDIIQQLADGEN